MPGNIGMVGDIPRGIEELARRFHPRLLHHLGLTWFFDMRGLRARRGGGGGKIFGNGSHGLTGQQ
jgi:hypothetical protein